MMKTHITVMFALLAMMFSLSACSLDTIIGAKPQLMLPTEKATVDPVPTPVVRIEAEKPNAPVPALEQRQVPVKEQPQTPQSVPSVIQALVPEPVQADERILISNSSPDLEFRNTVLAEDTVLRGLVHVTGWLTVPPQVTLTVEAGTVIRFKPEEGGGASGAGLMVQGRMVASGVPDGQILFSGAYREPADGDWQGIVLLATDKKNLLEQCRIEGAGVGLDAFHSQLTLRDFTASSCGTAIRLTDSSANVAGGAVSSCGVGVKSYESELELKDMNLSSNRQGIAVSGGSLYLSGSTFYGNSQAALIAESSRLKVTGCSFTVNGTGLSLQGSEGSVSFNRALNNREAGIVLANARINVNGNNISQNGLTGLRITGGGSVLWGNVIASNNGHDLDYSGDADLAVMGNWWGQTAPDRIKARIRKGDSIGKVLYMPILLQRPQSIM